MGGGRALRPIAKAPVEGAPSDGNRQLFSGMRRALGSSKIVVMDSPGADTFMVTARVKLTPTDERAGLLEVTWVLKDWRHRRAGRRRRRAGIAREGADQGALAVP